MSNPHETFGESLSHEVIIFTKFHEVWTKMLHFFLMANFLMCAFFSYSDFTFTWSKYPQFITWYYDHSGMIDAKCILQRKKSKRMSLEKCNIKWYFTFNKKRIPSTYNFPSWYIYLHLKLSHQLQFFLLMSLYSRYFGNLCVEGACW